MKRKGLQIGFSVLIVVYIFNHATFNSTFNILEIKEKINNVWLPTSMEEMQTLQKNAFQPVKSFISDRSNLISHLNYDESDAALESKYSNHIFSMNREDELDVEARKNRVLYLITTTYNRSSQIVDLTHLVTTFEVAKLKYGIQIYWIVVEDSATCTHRIRQILINSQLPFAHIAVKSGNKPSDSTNHLQYNAGLKIAEQVNVEGVIYFASGDHAFDENFFLEMTRTKRFGAVAVGFQSGWYERCKTDKNNDLLISRIVTNLIDVGNSSYQGLNMQLSMYMFTVTLLKKTKARFHKSWTREEMGPKFAKLLIDDVMDIEPLGSSCNAFYVWIVRNWHKTIATKYTHPDSIEQNQLMTNLL